MLRFAWTVPAGGSGAHVALAADSQALGGAAIRDGAGRDADLAHPGSERGEALPEPPLDIACWLPSLHAEGGPAPEDVRALGLPPLDGPAVG